MRLVAALMVAVVGFSFVPAPASADEILEAARRERVRREELKKKRAEAEKRRSKSGETEPPVLNAADLRRRAGTISTVGGDSSSGSAAGSATPAGSGAAKGDGAAWAARMADANAKLDAAQAALSESNMMINEYRRAESAIDDPHVRHAQTQRRLEAEGKLASLQESIQAARDGIEAVREDARKAGAPPGWLR